jgi:hypothetical protein
VLLGCISLCLTQSKDATDDSDEIPLSRSLASKFKGKSRPAQHRKAIRRQDDSDTHEDELPRTGDEVLSKGKRSTGAPGASLTTGARLPQPVLGSKRRRVNNPGGERDTVSRQRCQPQGRQLIVQSPGEPIGKQSQTSQPAIVITEVSYRPCLSVGSH